MCDAALGLAANGIDDASIEAFDQTIGLRVIRPGQAVIDHVFGADAIERMPPGRPIARLVLHVDGEAIGELAAVVGEDGVNAMREVSEEALEEAGGSLGIAVEMDLQVNVAGGPVDRDKDVALPPLESGQVLEIDV